MAKAIACRPDLPCPDLLRAPSARVLFALVLTLPLLLQGCADLPVWMVLQRKSAITDHQHFANAAVARAPVASALPVLSGAQPRHPDFGGRNFDQFMEQNGTVAFVVVQRGQVILERYYQGYQRDSLATSFSVAKSVVSALVGIAIDEGKIGSVDDPITAYVPELARRDVRFSKITIAHLLAMRSGIRFDEGYLTPLDDAARFYLTADLMSKIGGLEIKRAPDEANYYSSGDTQLLGLIVQRATGVPLARYLQDKIWQPMGAAYDASWSLDSDSNGLAKAFCCLNARALDFARFGLVYLHGGRFNGRQIVPEQWVRASTEVRQYAAADLASRWNVEFLGQRWAAYYTWQWRRAVERDPQAELGIKPRSEFYAQGLHGQLIYIAPEQEMVIVRLGAQNGQVWWPGLLGAMARMNGKIGTE